ncbi:hypothetical protein IG193_00155 [Infirmifilum lucidum]|uniref:Uncharacterized protein n=1 Tax=Infirmifilum lucidum TaxID=2776706 RepID=A0A7L9FJE1_9CREN|nr:hypothetical protein [Infirmifilum lucidum]QOJ78915.1 hypothetical protein IG193_00155 [Infirmifilum lucidum]
MSPPKLTRPILARHLAMCGHVVFGERYVVLENLKTPGGVGVDLAVVSTLPEPSVHAVIAAAAFSEARQGIDALVRVRGERVANTHWLAATLDAYVALGRPRELEKNGIGLVVVRVESTFGLGSAETIVELPAKPEARRAWWVQLEEALRARGRQDLVEALRGTLGKKPRV